MRKLTAVLAISLVASLPVFASAGAVKPPPQIIEGILGFLINKQIARGQETETTAGKITFNVYVNDGQGGWDLVDGWDHTNGKILSWYDDIALEPVVIINRSKGDPREVQFYHDSSLGNRTIFYAANKGGARGKNGEAKNNGGYVNKIPLLRVRDMPAGFNAIGARWGNGSDVAQFMKIDIAATYKKVIENPRIRAALAGAGGAVFPETPIMTLITDGRAEYIISDEELRAVMAAKNSQKPPKDPPKDPEEGKREGGGKRETTPNKPSQETSTWQFEVRRDFYVRGDLYEKFPVIKGRERGPEREKFLRDALMDAGPIGNARDFIEFRRTASLAILVSSSEQFEVTLVGAPQKGIRRGDRYEL